MAGLMSFEDFSKLASSGGLVPRLSVGQSFPPTGGGVIGVGGQPLPAPIWRVISQVMTSDVKDRFATGTSPDGTPWRGLAHPRPQGGDQPLRNTGVMWASIHGGYDANSAWVATTHPGAATHNFGAIIRGKGKMLAIPLTVQAVRAGSPRRWNGPPLRFMPTRRGRRFLLYTDVGGVRVGQYLLVDEVRIPQRRFMGLTKKAFGTIGQIVLESFGRSWSRGGAA